MYQIYISEESETLSIDTGSNKKIGMIRNLGILHSFLHAFLPLRQETVLDAMTGIQPATINCSLEAFKNDIFPPASQEQESAVPVNPYLPKLGALWYPLFGHDIEKDSTAFWLYIEYVCLKQAVIDWLVPKKSTNPRGFLTPSVNFSHTSIQQPGDDIHASWAKLLKSVRLPDYEMDQDSIDVLAEDVSRMSSILYRDSLGGNELEEWYYLLLKQYQEEVFRYRTRQVGVEMMVVEDSGRPSLSRLYSANEPLSLAWAEIMWSIDQNKYAQLCEVCGGSYIIKPPYQRLAYTCSAACAKQHKTIKMGGPEALREYNKAAKRRQRSKPIT